MSEINFFNEETDFLPPDRKILAAWLKALAAARDYVIEELNYIFCTDKYLHEINLRYLKHDTYTDIITFDNSDEAKVLVSDIFISVERVKENAESLGYDFEEELRRVMAHGLLHLIGYDDKSPELKAEMRQAEDEALEFLDTARNKN